jgi:predicted nucleic acid-binding protein
VLIVDTGVLVATADRSDADHAVCRSLLEDDAGPLVTTGLVVAEAAYLIDRQVGPDGEVALYTSIIDGVLIVESLMAGDWHRVRELVDRYRDLGLGGTDASLIAVAERLRANRVATLDRRHFSVVRPNHIASFELLPVAT